MRTNRKNAMPKPSGYHAVRIKKRSNDESTICHSLAVGTKTSFPHN